MDIEILQAIITEQTCGENCWHAREDVCRCSCGGRNHGILRTASGIQPVRTAKINGVMYELVAVQAPVLDGMSFIETSEPIDNMVLEFHDKLIKSKVISWGDIYHAKGYRMDAAPMIVKTDSATNVLKWPEFSAWRSSWVFTKRNRGPLTVWVRVDFKKYIQ